MNIDTYNIETLEEQDETQFLLLFLNREYHKERGLYDKRLQEAFREMSRSSMGLI